MKNNDHFFPYVASSLCGLIVYLAIIMATGRNEAWDDGSYYLLGMPFMCIVAFVIGLLIVAYQGYCKGEIRAGSSGFALLAWGILALAGIAEPLPLN